MLLLLLAVGDNAQQTKGLGVGVSVCNGADVPCGRGGHVIEGFGFDGLPGSRGWDNRTGRRKVVWIVGGPHEFFCLFPFSLCCFFVVTNGNGARCKRFLSVLLDAIQSRQRVKQTKTEAADKESQGEIRSR